MENYIESVHPIHDKEQLDAKWYDRFEKIGSFQAYEYFNGDKKYRNEQKEKFLTGNIDNPELDYPELKLDKIEELEAGLLELKKDILAEEENETVREVYRWKINEKIAELRMMKAAENGDMRRFQKYSEFVYGKPEKEIFLYTLDNIRKQLESDKNSENVNVAQASNELDSLLPKDSDTVHSIKLPDQSVVEMVSGDTMGVVGDLVHLEGVKETLDSDDIKKLFEEALKSLGSEDWSVELSENKASITANQEQKQIQVPVDKKLVLDKMRSLLAHEVVTHVARRVNGERSRLKLLGLGLDRYEKGEEGVATLREQGVKGEVEDFSGMDGHLAISLAYGVDGKKRNFRDVYAILEKYIFLTELKNGKSIEDAEKAAQDKAYDRCVRTFRGTDCKTPGAVFTKDIVYREGNIGVWDVVAKNKDELIRFSVGKYDPSNERHLWVLDTLGISDKDLEDLQETIE